MPRRALSMLRAEIKEEDPAGALMEFSSDSTSVAPPLTSPEFLTETWWRGLVGKVILPFLGVELEEGKWETLSVAAMEDDKAIAMTIGWPFSVISIKRFYFCSYLYLSLLMFCGGREILTRRVLSLNNCSLVVLVLIYKLHARWAL